MGCRLKLDDYASHNLLYIFHVMERHGPDQLHYN